MIESLDKYYHVEIYGKELRLTPGNFSTREEAVDGNPSDKGFNLYLKGEELARMLSTETLEYAIVTEHLTRLMELKTLFKQRYPKGQDLASGYDDLCQDEMGLEGLIDKP